ncbi:hypothetical protein Rs2_04869 [Raphanus sativus]|nr:hypothetical protein Rs2_04869 [Raphanus sativus]
MSSPPRFTFLASQNRSSLASTTEEHLPVLRSEKNNLEIAIERVEEQESNTQRVQISRKWKSNEAQTYLYTQTTNQNTGSNYAVITTVTEAQSTYRRRRGREEAKEKKCRVIRVGCKGFWAAETKSIMK